jgi:hypothetical protein
VASRRPSARRTAPHGAGLPAGDHQDSQPFDPKALDEYVRCFRDPAAIHGSCEDYRAAATIDLADDDASAARGEKVTAPLLALWGAHGFVGRHYDDVLAIWRQYAVKVDGGACRAGTTCRRRSRGRPPRLCGTSWNTISPNVRA